MEVSCPRCCSDKTVKNGQANGNPKRKCKSCYYQYTQDTLPGAPQNVRLASVVLYVHGLSINAIARLLNYTPPAVLRWIKAFGRLNYFKPEPISDVQNSYFPTRLICCHATGYRRLIKLQECLSPIAS